MASSPEGVVTFAEMSFSQRFGVSLKFEIQARIEERAEVSITIQKAVGVVLPEASISPKNVSLQLTTDAISGPIYFQKLGTFLTSPKIDWDFGRPPVAGQLLDFVFTFTYQSVLLPGDVIFLDFPSGFGGNESNTFTAKT